MQQLGVGRPQNPVTPRFYPQAEINVIECDAEAFVETVDFVEYALPHQHASRSYRREVLNENGAVGVPRQALRKVLVCVPSDTPNAKNDPSVLQGAVGYHSLAPTIPMAGRTA